MDGIITTIQRMSLHDGEGIRSTLFMKGCNFRCPWCHNPETWTLKPQLQYISSRCIGCYDCISSCSKNLLTVVNGSLKLNLELCDICGTCVKACSSGALTVVGRKVSPKEIVEELMIDKLFFDESNGGITISGGEPFLQPNFLEEVITLSKEKEVNVAIETNLSCNRSEIEKVVSKIDHWFIDLKSMNDTLHKEWVGFSNKQTLANIRFLADLGVSLTIRTPVIMGFNDNLESIKEICDFLESCNIKDYELLPFHKLGFYKFSQIGYENPMNNDLSLNKENFASLKKYVSNRLKIKQIMNYNNKIEKLREMKRLHTAEKIAKEGILDEDDYGRIVPPEGLWKITPNHEDGSFYGFDAWTENFCSLMDVHPLYVVDYDAFAGHWMYFMSKMRPNIWNPDYPYDHLKENIAKYDLICGIGCDAHFAPDYQLGVTLGWGGLIEKIEKYKAINTAPEQQHFYEIHLRAIRSIQGWIERHIAYAKELAESAKIPEDKEHYLEIAKRNEAIVSAAPTSFREACQWIIWYHLASRTYNRDGAGDQLDVLLYPFYKKDIERGSLDKETAIYYLSCFLMNDPIYWQIGGPDKDGNDLTNEMSFIILEAADRINTSLNITVRVHDALSPELMRKSVEYLVKNKNGWPRFSGNNALVEGFMRNGYSAELACKRIAVGCNWMSIPGLEYTMNDLVKVNMAKVFEVALDQMINDGEENSTSRLWDIFVSHLKIAVDTAAAGIEHHMKYQKFNEPELILNLLSYGPIERGCDVTDGGAEYLNLAIDGAGLAVVADSFAALERHIERDNTYTWDEVYSKLKDNYNGLDGEKMRLKLKSAERFGCEGTLGESWAVNITTQFSNFVRSHSNEVTKHTYIPGLFSWANTVGFGENLGATPDGRRATEPISHGANPSAGFVSDGASLSLAKAIAKVQPGYGNTAPMQWELDPTMAIEDNIQVITAIIKTHCNMGGTLINVNIMDKETVLKAHENPAAYPDLVVRITGFTAYFCMLSPQFRQLVVDRILEN